jgi:hypothetical protein
VPEEKLAGFGQRDRPRATGPLQEPRAYEPLERRDLLRDRGLRVAEGLRGPPERPFLRNSLKRRQMAKLDPEPLIVSANGLHRETDLSLSYSEPTLCVWASFFSS